LGTVSKQHLADLTFGKQVTAEYDAKDRYGRTSGKILINGRDINKPERLHTYDLQVERYVRRTKSLHRKARY
jgi:hypothetical protein